MMLDEMENALDALPCLPWEAENGGDGPMRFVTGQEGENVAECGYGADDVTQEKIALFVANAPDWLRALLVVVEAVARSQGTLLAARVALEQQGIGGGPIDKILDAVGPLILRGAYEHAG